MLSLHIIFTVFTDYITAATPPHPPPTPPLWRLRLLFTVINKWRGCSVTATNRHPWQSDFVVYKTVIHNCTLKT